MIQTIVGSDDKDFQYGGRIKGSNGRDCRSSGKHKSGPVPDQHEVS